MHCCKDRNKLHVEPGLVLVSLEATNRAGAQPYRVPRLMHAAAVLVAGSQLVQLARGLIPHSVE